MGEIRKRGIRIPVETGLSKNSKGLREDDTVNGIDGTAGRDGRKEL